MTLITYKGCNKVLVGLKVPFYILCKIFYSFMKYYLKYFKVKTLKVEGGFFMKYFMTFVIVIF